MSCTDKHKMVLQSMMWSKCVQKSELIEIFKKLQINENQLDSYITTINSHIDKFNLSIQRGIDSEKGDTYYALICITENAISKMASLYTAEQLEVLKTALEMIITKNGRFKAKGLVQRVLVKNVKFPVIKDIYHTIEEFVKEKYFIQIEEYFYIQPRALIEFNMYFRTYYADFVIDCALCKQLCIRPLKCAHCQTPYHKACADRFLEQQDKCLSCNSALELNRSIDSIGSPNNSQRPMTQDLVNDDESDCESLEERMDVVQSQEV